MAIVVWMMFFFAGQKCDGDDYGDGDGWSAFASGYACGVAAAYQPCGPVRSNPGQIPTPV
eukprot:12697241-Prorocentrum_lima.AAC.1